MGHLSSEPNQPLCAPEVEVVLQPVSPCAHPCWGESGMYYQLVTPDVAAEMISAEQRRESSVWPGE